jgi:hypothetical protein
MATVDSILSSLQSIAQTEVSNAWNKYDVGLTRIADLMNDADIPPIADPTTSITLSNADFELGDAPDERATLDPKANPSPAPDGEADLESVTFSKPKMPRLATYDEPDAPQFSTGVFTATAPDLADLDALLAEIEKPVLELAALDGLYTIEIPTNAGVIMPTMPNIGSFGDVDRPTVDTTPSELYLYTPSIGDAPVVTVPEFTTDNLPTDIESPPDSDALVATVKSEIDDALNGVLQRYIDNTVDDWQQKWAPEYYRVRGWWESRVAAQLDPANGFTIVSDEFETNLYTRAKNRVGKETRAVVDSVSNAMKKRGFVLPPAAMNSGIAKAQQQMADNLASQANEIAIERQRLEYEHTKFLMEYGRTVVDTLRNIVVQQTQIGVQAFQSAITYGMSILDTTIKAHSLLLEQYKTRAELYKTDAAIYEYRLKAALATLDIYRTEIEAEKVKAEAAKISADTYQARLEGEKAKVAIYAAELEGEKVKADIKRLEVDVYKAGLEGQKIKNDIYLGQIEGEKAKATVNQSIVEAYKARIEAEKAKIENYVAQLQGINAVAQVEKAKVDAFDSEVRAYASMVSADEAKARVFQALVQGQSAKMSVNSSLVEAYSKEVAAEASRMQAVVEANKGRVTVQQNIIEAYKAEIAAFVAENQAIASYNDVQGRKYTADIERYRGESQAKAAMTQAKAEGMRAQLAESVASANIQLSSYKAEMETKTELAKAYMQGEMSIGNALMSFAQSALSGVNGMVSETTTRSQSISSSTSTSVNR